MSDNTDSAAPATESVAPDTVSAPDSSGAVEGTRHPSTGVTETAEQPADSGGRKHKFVADAKKALRGDPLIGLQKPEKAAESTDQGEVSGEESDTDSGDQAEPVAKSEKQKAENTPEPSDSKETTSRSFEGIVPDEWEMRELPEGHPLRDRGVTHWPVVPGFENETNAFANSFVREKDLEEARGMVVKAQKDHRRLKTEVSHWIKKALTFASDPSVAVQVAKLRRDHSDEAAEAYIERMMRADLDNLHNEVQTQEQRLKEAEIVRVGTQFRQRVLEVIPEQLGITLDQTQQILAAYGTMFDTGQFGEMPHGSTFIPFAKNWLRMNDPAHQEQAEKEIEERVRQKILAEQQAEKEQRQEKIQKNPTGNLLGQSSAGTSLPGTSVDTASKSSVREARRNLRTSPIIGLGG